MQTCIKYCPCNNPLSAFLNYNGKSCFDLTSKSIEHIKHIFIQIII